MNSSVRTLLTRAAFEPVSDLVSLAICHKTAFEVLRGIWLLSYQVRSFGSVRLLSSGQEQVETS